MRTLERVYGEIGAEKIFLAKKIPIPTGLGMWHFLLLVTDDDFEIGA